METNHENLPEGTLFQSRSGLRTGTVGPVLGAGGQGAVRTVDDRFDPKGDGRG